MLISLSAFKLYVSRINKSLLSILLLLEQGRVFAVTHLSINFGNEDGCVSLQLPLNAEFFTVSLLLPAGKLKKIVMGEAY
jgi:hypothetical protein